jgi:flagellar biosynthesis/type III secretory pathway chaperone
MEAPNPHVLDLHEECTRLCAELCECLEQERTTLVEFKVEEIPHLTLRKESLMLALVRKRRELKDYVRLRYGLDKVSLYGDRLEAEAREDWLAREARWRARWADVRETVRRNQDFLRHSLKNLTALADNLKRCLGEPSLYSAKGTRVEMQTEGKVVAASY